MFRKNWVVMSAMVGMGCGGGATAAQEMDQTVPEGGVLESPGPDGSEAAALDAEPSPEAISSTPAPEEGSGEGEFVPWTAFENVDDSALGADEELRSAVAHAGYQDEELVIAVSSPSGNNQVLAVDLDLRTLRAMRFHLDCGDCRVGSSGLGVLLANAEGLWESRDGGYRFADIGTWQPSNADAQVQLLAGFGLTIWAKLDGQWQNAVDDDVRIAGWPGDVASVGASSALEVTARYATRHGDEFATSNNPCTALDAPYGWGTSWHLGTAALVSCGASKIAFTPQLGEQDFEEFQLDAPVQRMITRNTDEVYTAMFVTGNEPSPDDVSVLIATESSWYAFTPATRALSRSGRNRRAPLATAPSSTWTTWRSAPCAFRFEASR